MGGEIAQGRSKFLPVLSLVDFPEREVEGVRVERCPAQCEVAVPVMGDYRAVARNLDRQVEIRLVTDLNYLFADCGIDPTLVVEILLWVAEIITFDVQVLNVRPSICRSPGDPLIVAEDDRRKAG